MLGFLLLFVSIGADAFATDLKCLPHQHFVKGHARSGYIRWDGAVVRDHYVVDHCRDNHESYKVWGGSFFESVPEGWPHKEKFLKWKEFEKEEVLEALDKLPKYFSNFKDIKIYRANRSVTRDNYASSIKSMIVLYDNAFKDEGRLQHALLHEIAHVDFDRLSDKDRVAAAIAAGWVLSQNEKDWVYLRGNSVETDSNLSPTEAYANGIENYFINPPRLKLRDKILFEFLDQKFGKLKK